MIKLNRTTEYGLIALRHMSQKGSAAAVPVSVTSAREIADHYGLPFEITAKTLQRLKDRGFINSAQGARGGYTLRRSLDEVTLVEFMEQMEGPQSLVPCVPEGAKKGAAGETERCCDYHGRCEIKGMMGNLNQRIHQFLAGIRLGELTGPRAVYPISTFTNFEEQKQ